MTSSQIILSSYPRRVAKTVSCELTSFAPNSRCMSSMVSTEGLFYFNSAKVFRMNYSAPPTTRDSISTEEMLFQNILPY
jgi:hypothetical protein